MTAKAAKQPSRSYPISHWYLRPAASWLADRLAATPVRPVHLTVCGLIAAAGAIAVLLYRPEAMPVAAAAVWVYWFFDRADGLLARRQQTVSAWGAWLDGNVDELVDVAVHTATAAVVAARVSAPWPWLLLVGFLSGKYLFMYGLALEEHATTLQATPVAAPDDHHSQLRGYDWLRWVYHLPGNADVRAHLMVAALATGLLTTELVLLAVYYNFRWLARYGLVSRRLGAAR